ncbi:MAG: hypothetical protein JOS17DRAFT_149261 [Linnemannia elongata]|nr:MAG: hypothetical protein JOS17DRAFT_149261 [Linnemannia elongata]
MHAYSRSRHFLLIILWLWIVPIKQSLLRDSLETKYNPFHLHSPFSHHYIFLSFLLFSSLLSSFLVFLSLSLSSPFSLPTPLTLPTCLLLSRYHLNENDDRYTRLSCTHRRCRR